MKKLPMIIAICLIGLGSCSEKKTSEASSEVIAEETIDSLETKTAEVENITKEIEDSAAELDQLLEEL